MKRDTDRRITVEDLLRLKRAERPPAEFWATFESEIRAKQLSAIVNKRPWWDGISRVVWAVHRHPVPVGAAAALALAFIGVRYLGGPVGSVASNGASVAQPVAAAKVAAPVARPAARPLALPGESGFAAREATPVQAPVVAVSESHITKAPMTVATESASRSPFADGIVITFSDIREPAADYPQRAVFGSDSEFEPASTPARAPKADPLAGLDPAAERRARLLAPALPAYASGSSRAAASDWMKTRASSNERMYESMDQGPSDRMLVGFRF
jgi:hypothetical protein